MPVLIQTSDKHLTVRFFVQHPPAPKPVGPPKPKSTGYVKYKAFRELIQLIGNRHFRAPLRGAVRLSCRFYLPIPGSWGARARDEALVGHLPPITKPDLKNLIAGVEDALNTIAWLDDAQVTGYDQCFKAYSYDDEIGVAVDIELLDRGDEERIILPEL